MKVVGKLPQPKVWCVVKDKVTGKIYGGYDPHVYCGNYAAVLRKAEEASKYIAENTKPADPGERPPYPDWYDKSPAADEARAKYGEWSRKFSDCQHWDRKVAESNLEPFEYLPVFRDKLKFTHYSRGRSSVTMNFIAEDGSSLALGPSGIDAFLDGVAAKQIIVTDDGRFDFQFKLVKKGENVYMEPHYGPMEAV